MAKEIILTQSGKKKLMDELEELKTSKRQEVAEKLKVARSFGDLSENSEYDEAKNEQAIVEARIAEVEATLKIARVVDDAELNTHTINVGSKVKLYDKEFEEEVEYHLVGSTEADPNSGKISDNSPLGQALLGHKVGDTVIVQTPGGAAEYEVREIMK